MEQYSTEASETTMETAIAPVTQNLRTLIEDYATYNCWANTTLISWLRSFPSDALEREVPSSFPTIKQTLFHLWTVQSWWLGNLQQTNPISRYGEQFQGPLEEVYEMLTSQSEAFTAYVKTVSEESLKELRAFSIPTVGTFEIPQFEIAQHTVNHSTYHRGQIVTIARNLGITNAPMTDYMFYLIMNKTRG